MTRHGRVLDTAADPVPPQCETFLAKKHFAVRYTQKTGKQSRALFVLLE
jgi:hypothetical protein